MRSIGIRREDKDPWEARVPLVPDDAARLTRTSSVELVLQPSAQRVFTAAEYERAGARFDEDLSACDIVLAVKEIPRELFAPGKTYAFFSHTIKGQPYNMDMLRRLLELECQLIDYERITDERGRRLIFFSRFAGLAGAIDALWALGRRLEWEGLAPNPRTERRSSPWSRARRRLCGRGRCCLGPCGPSTRRSGRPTTCRDGRATMRRRRKRLRDDRGRRHLACRERHCGEADTRANHETKGRGAG